jgi:hypothetical protein
MAAGPVAWPRRELVRRWCPECAEFIEHDTDTGYEFCVICGPQFEDDDFEDDDEEFWPDAED